MQKISDTQIILGLNAYHGDAAACLVSDGELIAAAEEERFRRIKHWAGFPSESIRYCLEEAGLDLGAVGHIAINSQPQAQLARKLRYTLSAAPSLSLIAEKVRTRAQRASIEERLAEHFPDARFSGRVHRVEHHLAHLASCFYLSPYDRAAAVSVDGFGDFSSGAWGLGTAGSLEVDGYVRFPHSLGVFYQALTQYLGFPHYGDEYKVMGLAPYGEPCYLEQMRRIVLLRDDGAYQLDLRYFRHHRHAIGYEWRDCAPQVSQLFSDELAALLGPVRAADAPLEDRHHDIARSVQAMYEDAFFHLLNSIYRRHQVDDLTLAGGCAMNSVANGKITQRTPFRRVYVQSAAGDAGGAIGAAFSVWHDMPGERQRFHMRHAYWGPQASHAAIADLVHACAARLDEQACTSERVDDDSELCARVASAIADGRVIGWFQGRMEWGPRALGNRSILCDPRRADMKDILNSKIKRRESFRPFAPSILREAVSEWFEIDDDVPFMMKVFMIRADRRQRIPAVTHVDGSGRLQTVYLDSNPRYYRLIEAFAERTGVPILLNTSFNENEPVVCRPREALDCFLRTNMDMLVLQDWVIERQPSRGVAESAQNDTRIRQDG